MLIFLLLIGIALMVTAFTGTYAQLATELESDIPGFFKWGIALALIVAFGYLPGMQKPSRWILTIVVLVLVLKNFNTVKTQLTNFINAGSAAPNPNTTTTTTAGASTNPLSGQGAIVQPSSITSGQGATTSDILDNSGVMFA